MEYQDHVNTLRGQDPELASQIERFNTLENVLDWMRQRRLPLGSIDAVTQDEFSHDVVIPLEADGRHLVFGIT